MAKTAAVRFSKVKTFDIVDASAFAVDGRLHFDVEYDSGPRRRLTSRLLEF
jgi:hypothetical protein